MCIGSTMAHLHSFSTRKAAFAPFSTELEVLCQREWFMKQLGHTTAQWSAFRRGNCRWSTLSTVRCIVCRAASEHASGQTLCAKPRGVRVKTDRADAKMPAQMGAVLELVPDTPQTEDHHIVRELQTVCTGLVKAEVQARNQLAQQKFTLTQTLTHARIRQIEGQIKKIDAEINTRLETCPNRKQALEIIKSFPGLGQVVANTIAFRSKPESLAKRETLYPH
jgi:transposase